MFKKFFSKKNSPPQEEFYAGNEIAYDEPGQQPGSEHSHSDEQISIQGAFPEKKPYKKTQNSFRRKMKRALIGCACVVMGVIIFIVGRNISGGADVAIISPASVSPQNDKNLVYVSGPLNSIDFSDPLFNVSFKGLGLDRVVEMYQWSFENGQYVKKWSDELIKIADESAKDKGFVNPADLPLHSEKWPADKLTIGAFTLSPGLFAKLTPSPLSITLGDAEFKKLPPEGQMAFKLIKGSYFFGLDPDAPNIGDLRVSFNSYPTLNVSIVAQQSGNTLTPYAGSNGTIAILRQGNIALKELLKDLDLGKSTIKLLISAIVGLAFGVIGLFIILGKSLFAIFKSRQIVATDAGQELAESQNIEKDDQEQIHEEEQAENHPQIIDNKDTYKSPFAQEESVENQQLDEDYDSHELQDGIQQDILQYAETEYNFANSENQPVDLVGQLATPEFFSTENADLTAPRNTPPPYKTPENEIATGMRTPDAGGSEYSAGGAFGLPAGLDFDQEQLDAEIEVLDISSISPIHALELDYLQKQNIHENIFDAPPAKAVEDLQEHSRPYSDSGNEDSSYIPEYVDFLTEPELEQEVRIVKKPEEPNEVKPPAFIDFYPDENSAQDLATPPEITEDEFFQEAQMDEAYEDEAYEDEINPENPTEKPEPPTNRDVSAEETQENKPAIKIIPPPPDLESLLAYVRPGAVYKTETPEPVFDLPPLPDDFDPALEMKAPGLEEGTVQGDYNNIQDEPFAEEGEDAHSPFGDNYNPFATDEDEGKK